MMNSETAAGDGRSSRGRSSRADVIAGIVCYLLAAAMFTQLATTLVIGLITAGLYLVFWRRSWKAIVLAVSIALSAWALEYFGGMVIRWKIAKTHHIGLDHRMKPNAWAGINSDGLRCSVEADDFHEETYNIVFLGDSFTYGEGLRPGEEPFPAVIEEMLGSRQTGAKVRTINFGWVSASPLLSARQLREIGAKYKPDLVVLCLDLTDFHDDLSYALGPRYVGVSPIGYLVKRADLGFFLYELRDRWNLATLWDAVTGRKTVLPKDRFFAINRPLGESLEYMAQTEANVRDIADYSRQALDARFILILLPRSFQYSDRECPDDWERPTYTPLGPFVEEPFKWLAAFAARVDFPCFGLLEDFKKTRVFPTCLYNDPHWNLDGHKVAAEAIVKILERQGVVESAVSPSGSQSEHP